jgi:hypothetical protein
MTKSNTAAAVAKTATPAGVGAGAADEPQRTEPANAGTGAIDTGAGADQAGADAANTGASTENAGDSAGAGDSAALDQAASVNQPGATLPASPVVVERLRAVVLFSGAGVSHRVGAVVEGPADLIDRLDAAGDVDSHPSAVDAALAGGVAPVSLE